jgi:hypothetical protein
MNTTQMQDAVLDFRPISRGDFQLHGSTSR